MAWLPSVCFDSFQWRLPLCDASTVRLVDAMSAGDRSRRVEDLAETLLEDPSLALWAVCASRDTLGGSAANVAALAGWLAGDGRDALAAEADDGLKERPDAESAMRLAELAARAVATRRGAQRAGASPEAQLTALLSDADRWFSAVGPAVEPGCLPAWLAEARTDAADAARNASARFRDDSDEVKQRWLVAIPEAGTMLARLCLRLARLERAESDFDRTLETEKLAAMKQLAYGAGHEINNPLANISTCAQTLLFDETDPERRRKLATINAQAFRAHEMIADLMLFAMPPAIKPEAIDAAGLVDGVIDEIRPTAEAQRTVIARVGDAPDVPVEADPTQLAVAIKAIVVNALEAIGHAGRIELELRASRHEPGGTVIEIRDNGPGIPPETRRHLFDPFFSGREAGRGLGFGLSKAWRIVRSHGGRIDVESEMDRGATFRIRLK